MEPFAEPIEEPRNPRLKLFLLSVTLLVAGTGLASVRVTGHRFAPDLLPKLTSDKYADDICVRIAGLCTFWGIVGLILAPFVGRGKGHAPPPPAPDRRPGGVLALGTARYVPVEKPKRHWVDPETAAAVSVNLRIFISYPLWFLWGLCWLCAGLWVLAYLIDVVPRGPYPKEIVLVAAFVAVLVSFGLRWVIWTIYTMGRIKSDPFAQRPVGAGNAGADEEYRWGRG